MAYENLCMYCFKDLNGAGICPHCGKDSRAAVPQIQMLPGTLVYHDRFLIGRALGQDAGGIVYTALDTRKGGSIRIREYLPRNCAERLNDGGVVPVAGMEDAFESGMRKLRASVESVEDPRKRHFYFEENGTAYIAQRKNVKGMPAHDEDDMEDDDRERSHSIALYIAIAAAVVVAIAIAIIWFLSSMSDPNDLTTIQPLQTVSAEATWMPEETPTPTPYATATFAALVDPELSWMDYTYSGDVESEYQDKQDSIQPTRKPTIIEEEDYDTINPSSNEKSVEELQQRLAKLGWLNYQNVTGRYDSATKNAVKEFQRYVNDYCSPAEKLAVDGIAGKKTQQWLYNSSVSLTRPTPTPEPLVTPKPDSDVVDGNSSAREIKAVQNQLIILGLLPTGSNDGSYGSATKTAVKNFQIRVNQLQGYNALEISGKVDGLTQAYLDYYVDDYLKHLEEQDKENQATPTPKPTKAPQGGTINADSNEFEITAVQEQLVQVGLLDSWDVDGVYGRGTVAAVKIFQRWINEQRKEETLAVTGECDLLTQRYLQHCIEKNITVSLNTPTPKPTETPEPDPEQNEGNFVIDPSSPKESIRFVQEMLASVGLLDSSDVDGDYGNKTSRAVKNFQRFINDYYGSKKVEETGLCDEITRQYLEYAYSEGWNIGEDEGTGEPDPTEKPTASPEPEEEYETVNAKSSKKKIRAVQELLVNIGLLDSSDVDGSYGKKTKNAVKTLQQYVNQQLGEDVLEISGTCDPLTRKYLEYCNEKGMDVGSAMKPGEDEPAKPADPPSQQPEEPDTPAVSQVKGFTVEMDGREVDGSLVEIDSGKRVFSWSAKSGVESYQVYFYRGDGSLYNSKTSSKAGEVTIKAKDLNMGEIYRLEIGAMPKGGSENDIIWQSIQIVRYSEPEVEQPTPEPKPEVADISKPSISLGSPARQEDGVPYISGDTVIFSWMAEGDVEYYVATLYHKDGATHSLGETQKTSATVPTEQLQSGLWKLEIGAMPKGGSKDDMKWNELIFGVPAAEPEVPDEPEQKPDAPESSETITYIDADSDPEQIQMVQQALYRHGLLNPDDISVGSLDEVTVEAVIEFQKRVIEVYGIDLDVIDPENDEFISLDEFTLDCLLYRELDLNV